MNQLTDTCALRAEDIMRRRSITIGPTSTLRELAALLGYYGRTEVSVVDPAGKLLGHASAAVIFRLAGEDGAAQSWDGDDATVLDSVKAMLDQTTVAEIMTPVTVSIPPSAEASEIARTLLRSGVTRVPVLKNSRFVGVVTFTDLLRALARPD